MSGGYFDYRDQTLKFELDSKLEEEEFRKEFPVSFKLIQDFVYSALDVLHKVDYHMSGDSLLSDEELKNFIKSELQRLSKNL
jgi:hypothetical protein